MSRAALLSTAALACVLGCAGAPPAGAPREPGPVAPPGDSERRSPGPEAATPTPTPTPTDPQADVTGRSDVALSIEPMTLDDARLALRESAEPSAIFRAAYALARDETAGAQAALREALLRESVLEHLGAAELERGPLRRDEPAGHRSGLAQVIFALRDNPSAAARGTLLALIGMPGLRRAGERMHDNPVDWLLRASARIVPPTAAVIRFWRQLSHPDDGYVSVTVHALLENGSTPALRLVHDLLRDPRHDVDTKIAWLRENLVFERHRPEIAAWCAAELRTSLDARLRSTVIDALFDYDPARSPPDTVFESPVPIAAWPEATRTTLAAIAREADQHLTLTDRQRAAIQTTLGATTP